MPVLSNNLVAENRRPDSRKGYTVDAATEPSEAPGVAPTTEVSSGDLTETGQSILEDCRILLGLA